MATAAYEQILKARRDRELARMTALRYTANAPSEETTPPTEGNPLVHHHRPHHRVAYSELKVWSKGAESYEIEQSFRVIGKPVNAMRLHPQFPLFAIAVECELQLWKLAGKWQLWKSAPLREVPHAFLWSPDGSILAIQFTDHILFFDIAACQDVADAQFGCAIISAVFTRDLEMVIGLENGVSCFDLRSLSVTDHYFAHPDCIAACPGAFAFAVNGPQPRIVLSVGPGMKSWQLPTTAAIRACHISPDKAGLRISIIDEENFIWSVDEYGTIEERTVKLTIIPKAQVERPETKEKVAVKVDKTREILDLLSFPSHQIPKIADLCPALFAILLEPREQPEVASIAIPVDEEVVDETIGAVPLGAAEMAQLRAILG
jgi:hypothetical protein